jgi:hypothetical protein
LEEWALCILQPEKDQEFQLNELYDNDAETTRRWDRVVKGKKPTPFNITTKNFTAGKDNIDVNTKNNNLDGLDTNTNRHDRQSNQELTLVVNTFLIESLQKADKRKKLTKKIPKRISNMKKAYDAASAFTTIMNNTLDRSSLYEDFTEMNQDMLHQVNLTSEKNQQMTVTNPHPRVVVLVRMRHLLHKRKKNRVLNLSSKFMGRKVTMKIKML